MTGEIIIKHSTTGPWYNNEKHNYLYRKQISKNDHEKLEAYFTIWSGVINLWGFGGDINL